MADEKPKRGRGRPRLTQEEREARQKAENKRVNEYRSRNNIVERAKNGVEIAPNKVARFASPEALAESNKALVEVLYEASLPKVRSDDELAQRFEEYFKRCVTSNRIPTVEEAILCTGYDYRTMYEFKIRKKKPSWGDGRTAELIEWATDVCRTYDAKMVMAGILPQIPYIFRSKNYYDMSDKREVEVIHNVSDDKPVDLNEIAKRYGIETTFEEDK